MSQDETSKKPDPISEPRDVERRAPAGAWQTMGQPETVSPDPRETPEGAVAPADAPTIGTGTSIALGCVAGTILLIVIGLIYILIAALF